MKWLVNYIKEKRKIIEYLVICVLCFSSIFSLYDLPMEAVYYAAVLCVFFGVIFAIADGLREHNKLKILKCLRHQIMHNIEELPHAENLIEKEYQNIIQKLCADINRLSSEYDSKTSDMVDYYTLWVHQIKTPIVAMRLLLQLEDTEQNRELFMELFKIEQYVEMVLGYLRLDSDTTDFVIARYDLDSIVKQAVRKYSKQFIRKKINLEYSSLNCEVLTDEKWLVFVIEQVLSNALKYTNEGKISIYMEQNKTLVIQDTGIGIQEEDLPRVFEKGFTGYNGRYDKKSTGIGLYICKKTIDKLGHSINITADVAKGTKVKINLNTIELVVE